MTADTPEVTERERDDESRPKPDDTAVIRSTSRQTEGYSVRPRPVSPNDGSTPDQTGSHDAGGNPTAIADTIACEDDVLVLLPSEEVAAASQLQEPDDLSWQTEALAAGAATEQFSAAHDDVGFLPTESMSQSVSMSQSSVGAEEVPLLTAHPDFATAEMTEEMTAADLPELEDVEDITALVDDDSVELDAPDDSFEIDFDEFQVEYEEQGSKIPTILAAVGAAAAVIVCALLMIPTDSTLPTESPRSVAVVDSAAGAESAEVVAEADSEPGAVEAEASDEVPMLEEVAVPDELIAQDSMNSEAMDSEAMTDPEGTMSPEGAQAESISVPETVTQLPVDNSLEGWLERSLQRHFDLTQNVK